MSYTSNPQTIEKFLALEPYLFDQIGGYRFFEHPKLGDEAPIMMLTPNDKFLVSTGFYDLEDFDLELCQAVDPDNICDMTEQEY